jgi:prevent-host-death family protein
LVELLGAASLENGGMKKVALSELKEELSRYLREAATEPLLITRHGKPAGVLIGFADEEDWFDYRLENDPKFAKRVAKARRDLRAGRAKKLEDVSA